MKKRNIFLMIIGLIVVGDVQENYAGGMDQPVIFVDQNQVLGAYRVYLQKINDWLEVYRNLDGIMEIDNNPLCINYSQDYSLEQNTQFTRNQAVNALNDLRIRIENLEGQFQVGIQAQGDDPEFWNNIFTEELEKISVLDEIRKDIGRALYWMNFLNNDW